MRRCQPLAAVSLTLAALTLALAACKKDEAPAAPFPSTYAAPAAPAVASGRRRRR